MAKGLADQADYDAAMTTYESNVAAQKSLQSQLDRAIINLNYATIRAPISGVVISRAVDIGQTVAASFATPTLFTIANDLTRMQVQAAVDEADIGRVRDGEDVLFTVDAYPELTFHGTVTQIQLAPVTVQNVITYTVVIEVPNPDLKLMPGMTATSRFLSQKKRTSSGYPLLLSVFNLCLSKSKREKIRPARPMILLEQENGENCSHSKSRQAEDGGKLMAGDIGASYDAPVGCR